MDINFALLLSFASLLVGGYLYYNSFKYKMDKKVKDITGKIRKGAISFLKHEYTYIGIFVLALASILLVFNWQMSLGFVLGALFSGFSGVMGMLSATQSNGRAATACIKNKHKALNIAFRSGGVMSMIMAGLGLLGVTLLFIFFEDINILYAFGFGASSISLFARVGGGIYTKAADMGADLVGKVEEDIPEDDPRNPGVIADNVGDNVGDVAGMGADLFESYVNSIIASVAIGSALTLYMSSVLPLLLASVGIIASAVGMFFVRGKRALNKGLFSSAILMAIFSFVFINHVGADINIFYAVLSGLITGLVIGLSTEYFTSYKYSPVQKVAKSSKTGASTNIISGLSNGLISIFVPVLAVSATVFISYILLEFYGIALSALGMLSTLGMSLAIDAYGPVVDNAAGIAEMSGLKKKARTRAEELDEEGNTTAAIGKGFAIGSAALTAMALFSVYIKTMNIETLSITNPSVFVGMLLGGMLPFLFSSFTLSSVNKSAIKIVEDIRKQFKDGKIMKGKKKPDYDKVIKIATQSALREMIIPTLIAILSPIIVGLVLGPEALGGLLAASIVTGFMLAVILANAGGAWDNAKKYIEKGELGGKGSEPHKAAVIGDTVGDPCKDTSGPALNILIKLMNIVALVFIPLLL